MTDQSYEHQAIAKTVASLYEDPITLQDLQEKLLYSPFEVGGPTPPKDEKIYSLVYNYLQTHADSIDPNVASRFSVLSAGGWICCGRELAKFLALMPQTSLQDLMDSAAEHGFEVQAVAV